tara:strand:- start:77 stop:343 length:267 start_codon:yes stop_codon:yes gene_type:complete
MRTSFLFDHPSPCRECGKAAAKRTTTEWYTDNEMPPYTGNQIVLKTLHRHRLLWDGETYIQRYGYFCSLNCTSAYANRIAHRQEGTYV